MSKVKDNLFERRRFIRFIRSLEICYSTKGGGSINRALTKNISADGLRFEALPAPINEGDMLDIKLTIPSLSNPVHAEAKVVWKKKISLEDAAPFSIGLEFISIEEDNKNTFLKFLCDTLYAIPEGAKDGSDKKKSK